MSEIKNETKSISEIMEMIDYSFGKNEPHARKTLAQALSKQLSEAEWGVELAGRYIDDLEAALSKEVPTIDKDEEVTTDDLPFK